MNLGIPHNQSLTEEQFHLLTVLQREYTAGMLALNSLGPKTFTFYGGHRVQKDDKAYKTVYEIAQKLAKEQWGVVSGGGPGIMAAALEGSLAAGGKTVAFCIDLENEPTAIEFPDVSLTFTQFSARKYALRQSDAFAFAPGGFGTLDELMELLTLIKTLKYPKKPIFLLDSSFWKGYLTWFEEILLNERRVVASNILDVFELVDSPDQVMDSLKQK